MTNATPILIVDDHPVFRLGLASVLTTRGFSAVMVSDGSVTDPAALVPVSTDNGRWVAILDVRLGSVDGITLCRLLRALPDPPVVIMLSTFDDPAVIQAARDAGAFAFLSKGVDSDQICETIDAGLSGRGSRIRDQGTPDLTRREREVLLLLREGCDTKTIAARLTIGSATVRDHLDNLYSKLGVSDRLNAVRRAAELGLFEVLG